MRTIKSALNIVWILLNIAAATPFFLVGYAVGVATRGAVAGYEASGDL